MIISPKILHANVSSIEQFTSRKLFWFHLSENLILGNIINENGKYSNIYRLSVAQNNLLRLPGYSRYILMDHVFGQCYSSRCRWQQSKQSHWETLIRFRITNELKTENLNSSIIILRHICSWTCQPFHIEFKLGVRKNSYLDNACMIFAWIWKHGRSRHPSSPLYRVRSLL